MTTSYKSWDAAKPHYKRLLLNMPENAKSAKVNSSPVAGAKTNKSEPLWLGFVCFYSDKAYFGVVIPIGH